MSKKISLLIILVLCLMLAIPGYAKKGGGKTGGTTVTTEALWGVNITEAITDPRPCVAAQIAKNGSYGSYICEVTADRTVTYTLLGVGVPTARSSEPSLCGEFQNITLTPSRYFYGWNDNCDDGNCTIQISNWFSDKTTSTTEVFTATEGKADRITLRAFAEATGTFSDANPFVDSLMLDVDEIIIQFSAAGSNKNIAVCRYTTDLDNLGNVTFQTDPR